jgi:quercetin dioxygenase-like cupin family protein
MAMPSEMRVSDAPVPITGRRLALPDDPIFHIHRADQSDYEIGEFRAWAGYKNLGADTATDDLLHFQHVLSFAGTAEAGRTGVHAHLAHAHSVIPTSGRGVFSYDGVVTEALPGGVIVQHGGTIHDQFEFSYAAADAADNRRTPLAVEPPPSGAAPRSFGFLELFVPKRFANVEIVPPGDVTAADQASAWDHPYHAAEAGFFLQSPEDPAAGYRPLAGRPDLEVRDADTWAASGGLAATWIVRPATAPAPRSEPPGIARALETGGVEILFMVAGSARFEREGGEAASLGPGDTLTCSAGLVGDPVDCSPDMRLLRLHISAKAQTLRERTADEIQRLEALGPALITRYEVRPEGDRRPINALRDAGAAPLRVGRARAT